MDDGPLQTLPPVSAEQALAKNFRWNDSQRVREVEELRAYLAMPALEGSVPPQPPAELLSRYAPPPPRMPAPEPSADVAMVDLTPEEELHRHMQKHQPPASASSSYSSVAPPDADQATAEERNRKKKRPTLAAAGSASKKPKPSKLDVIELQNIDARIMSALLPTRNKLPTTAAAEAAAAAASAARRQQGLPRAPIESQFDKLMRSLGISSSAPPSVPAAVNCN